MWRFEWCDAMSVAIDELDEDHKRAVRFLNLIGASATSGDLASVARLTTLLAADMASHFRREERILKRHGFPRLATHAAGHAEAIGLLDAFAAVAARRNIVEILQWCDKLRLFFVERLIMDDLEYKWFFADNRIEPVFDDPVPVHNDRTSNAGRPQ